MRHAFALSLAALGLLACAVPSAQAAPHQVKSFHASGDGGWDYLLVDSATRRFYISRGTHVMVLNADTGASIGDIPNTEGVHGVALAPKLGRGFTSNGRGNSVTVFNLNTLKPVGLPVPVGQNPDCILYDPAAQRVFTFNGESNDATAVNAATGKVAGTIALGGRPEYAVADGKGEVFVNIEDKSEIVALNSRTLKIVRRWSIAPGDGPSGIAMDVAHRRLFSVCGNQMMVVSNADTGKVVATPAIGDGPDACIFDPARQLAISSNGAGSLTLVHEDSPNKYRVQATVPTQPGARTEALDAKTHRIYTVAAKTAPPPAGAPTNGDRRRRSYLPGTFTVLVYGGW